MKRTLLAIALAALAAGGVYLALAWRAEPPVRPPRVEIATDRPEAMPPDHLARRAQAERAGEIALASGERAEIDARSLAAGRPVVLHLLLAEPSRTAEPLPVRIVAADGRARDLESVLGDDRLEARVEIDPAFLEPGRYMLQVRTTEQSPLPLRRYVIEVK